MTELTRRSFITGGAIAAAGGMLALAGCAQGTTQAEEKPAEEPAAPEATAAPAQEPTAQGGAYVGHGIGKHGDIDIEVVTDTGKIERITVLKSRETAGMGDVAMAELTDLIVDNQTLNVDTIAGATLSSIAFMQAVAEALDAAGESSAEWRKREKAELAAFDGADTAADVVVVGGGGAGFAAAITAANEGKKVVLLEKLGVVGGDTSLSGGEMAVPRNWIQLQDPSIQDSPELLAEDMLTGGDNVGDPELVKVIANGTLDASQWLTFEAGVSWEHDCLFFGGHSVERSIIPRGHTGSEMITKLASRADAIDNLTVIRNMRATELVTEGGKVCGVKAEDKISGKEYTFTAGAVVLASGGFGSNVEMRKQYNPEMDEAILSTDSVGAEGDGLVMAQAIGANLIDMQYIQTYPTCDPDTGALLYVDDMRLESRAIMINKEGQRFVEELDRRDVLSNAIKEQTGGMAYMLWNQAAADDTKLLITHEDEYENLESRGIIVKADTLEAACEPFGIDAAALQETVDKWNEYCVAGSDPEFNYRSDMTPIEGGPYYINSYKPAVHYTMGGLHINTSAQVLDDAGAVIPGLFACGEVAGHKMGTNRLGSCSMADIYTFGRIAGKGAADFAA